MLSLPIDLSRTPGINYALAYWLSCMVYIAVNPARPTERWRRVSIAVAMLIALSSFMVATDGGIDVVFFVPCMLLDVAMMLLLIHECCDMSWKKAAYFCARAFLLGEFAASVEWQVYYYLCANSMVPYGVWQGFLFLLVVYAPVFGCMYLLERRWTEENAQLQITSRELGMVLLVTVSVYALSNLSYVYTNTPFSSQFTSEIFIIRSLVDMGGVGILFAMHMHQQSFNMRMEVEYLQKLLAMQYENYKINEESVRLVNQKYHDLKHQIALLRSELTSGEKLEYLDRMERDIRSYEAQNKTGNAVLDTVLTAKSLQCQREGIGLTCTADGQALSFMDPMDISALFGNALDNAIESVGKVESKEKRLIHLTINRQRDFVRIHMENYYEGEIRFVNGMPATSKKDSNFHGFGIKSIRSIVEKYGGSLTIHAENSWFELRILFNTSDLPAAVAGHAGPQGS